MSVVVSSAKRTTGGGTGAGGTGCTDLELTVLHYSLALITLLYYFITVHLLHYSLVFTLLSRYILELFLVQNGATTIFFKSS